MYMLRISTTLGLLGLTLRPHWAREIAYNWAASENAQSKERVHLQKITDVMFLYICCVNVRLLAISED